MAVNESEKLSELGCPIESHHYAGDGVYLGFDGYHIIAVARQPEGFQWIAFEADVMRSLREYAIAKRVIR